MKNLLITLLFTLIGITTYAQDSIRIDENGGFSQVITTKITANPSLTGKNIFHKYSGCFV